MRVVLRLLGLFEAHNAESNAITIPIRKAQALLGTLALSPNGRQTRERLLGLLWSERSEAQARHSLSQTLTTLRHLLGRDALDADRDTVALVLKDFEIDVRTFLIAAKSNTHADLDRAAHLYRGPLLDGLTLREQGFEAWLGMERRRLADTGVDILERLSRMHAQCGHDEAAVGALERALAIDPLVDTVHIALMRFHLDRGRLAAVARHHAYCVALYQRELGVGPGGDIDRLAAEASALCGSHSPTRNGALKPAFARQEQGCDDRILPSLTPPKPAVWLATTRGRASLVVMPFDNINADYFADSIVEEITTALGRVKDFFVIARQSAFTYKGRYVDVRSVGRDLGVAYVVGGTVRRSMDHVRVSVQLINAETRMQLWSGRFEGSDTEPFQFQDQVASQVTGAVHTAVRDAEIVLAKRKLPHHVQAYDLVLRAYPHLWSQNPDKNRQAICAIQDSIAIDGEYGLSHAMLAWCHAQEIVYFWSADPARDQDRVWRAVEAASSLIGDDPTAMAAAGAALSQCGDQEHAAGYLEKALALDPNNAWSWARYGYVALYSNDPEAARERFERSLALSPLDPFAFNTKLGIAMALGMAGSYPEATAMARDVVSKHPSVTWAYRMLASYSALTGDLAVARKDLRKLLADLPTLTVDGMKHTHPLRHVPRYYDKLVEGLGRAGLPHK